MSPALEPPAADPQSFGALLAWARASLASASDTPRLDAEILLAFATGASRAAALAFPERVATAAQAAAYRDLVALRAEGRPLAVLVGRKEFYSLPLGVDASVLVPRPETELVVDEALALLPVGAEAAVLDLGTGSGAIALAIKHARPEAAVTAVDIDASALTVARRNAAALALEVRFVRSDWYGALPGERFRLIVGNPPYVRSADPLLSGALRFEPRIALDGGEDGLACYRAIFGAARAHLINRGYLLVEHGADQRAALEDLARRDGLDVVRAVDDLEGRARVLVLRA
jgi:release factor glutamine methyltransferase